MSERPLPPGPPLAGPLLAPGLPRSLDEMPPAMLARSRSRLAAVTLGAFLFLLAATLTQLALFYSVGLRSMLYQPRTDLVSEALCFVLYLAARSRRLRDQAALRVGLALQIA